MAAACNCDEEALSNSTMLGEYACKQVDSCEKPRVAVVDDNGDGLTVKAAANDDSNIRQDTAATASLCRDVVMVANVRCEEEEPLLCRRRLP